MNKGLKLFGDARKTVFTAAVFALAMMFMLWQVNFYLFANIRNTYFMALTPVLVAASLYFWRLKNRPEYTLLVVFWLWYAASRILNGDPVLVYDFSAVTELSLMIPFFVLGLVLDTAARKRFLNWFSAAVGGYYFVLGLICLTAVVLRTLFVNPITGGVLGFTYEDIRINILDTNPCASAYWYMIALLLMVYQFFACGKKLWRIPIVIAAIVDYAVIAATYTRSVKVSVAVCMALLMVLLAFSYLRIRKKALLSLALAGIFLVSLPLFYKGFDLFANVLGRISIAVQAEEGVKEAEEALAVKRGAVEAVQLSCSVPVEESETEQPDEDAAMEFYVRNTEWNGNLDEFSSGRMEIYQAAFRVLKENPSIILKGTLSKDTMTAANEILSRPQPHFHNLFIQVLMISGLPGLFVILALCLLLVFKTVKLFFSHSAGAGLAVKILALPVTGALIYSMFEACIFTTLDARPLYFYILCGVMLGFYYDIYPRKTSD